MYVMKGETRNIKDQLQNEGRQLGDRSLWVLIVRTMLRRWEGDGEHYTRIVRGERKDGEIPHILKL